MSEHEQEGADGYDALAARLDQLEVGVQAIAENAADSNPYGESDGWEADYSEPVDVGQDWQTSQPQHGKRFSIRPQRCRSRPSQTAK